MMSFYWRNDSVPCDKVRSDNKVIRFLRQILYRSIDNKDISYEDLKELMRNREIYLIDVRSKQEYEEGHLDGAMNISLYNIEKEIEKTVKNKSSKIILYCSSGTRSKKAKKILENLGYNEVYNLEGGIDKIWIK